MTSFAAACASTTCWATACWATGRTTGPVRRRLSRAEPDAVPPPFQPELPKTHGRCGKASLDRLSVDLPPPRPTRGRRRLTGPGAGPALENLPARQNPGGKKIGRAACRAGGGTSEEKRG